MSDIKSMYDLFATDESKEIEGIWLDYGPAGRIRIARAGQSNKLFQKTSERVLRPHSKAIEKKTIDPDLFDDLLKQIYVRSIILGWENVRDREGNELSFSADNVMGLLNDLPDLWVEIREQAMTASNFLEEGDTEEDSKN